MKTYLYSTLILMICYLKRNFRDKTALFFSFLFPLMFLLVFGAMIGNQQMRFDLVVINKSTTDFAAEYLKSVKEIEYFNFDQSVTDRDQALEMMRRGEIDTVLEIPAEFGQIKDNIPTGAVIVYYQQANPQAGQAAASIIESVGHQINFAITGVSPPITVEPRSIESNNLTNFDYTFAGLLGFTILSIGIFNMAATFPTEKRTGAFRRLQVAPVRASQLILANAGAYLIISLLSLVLMWITALLVFDFTMRGDYLSIVLFLIVSVLAMFGFGLAIGAWAKNENQAAPISNLISFPLMFLSGVFFPRFLMPEWLQTVTVYLPLTPIVDGIRMISAEGKTILELGTELSIIAVWLIVVYFTAIRLFRWR